MIAAVMPTYARADLAFVRGEGPYLFTEAGERYLDFGGGIAVAALGHAHPHLAAALSHQATRLWHTSNLDRIPGQERLARRLTAATFAATVFFANSGAEAIECALKIARRYHWARGQPQRHRTIAFHGAFHGRTLATLAAAGQPRHLEGFGPPAPGFDHIPLHDDNALRAAIGSETAAILIEPVQGEGGIVPVSHRFLETCRQAADEFGLLLIYDEVQCGMGRTGKLFAHEWSGVAPDLMATAKALGNGMPIGACLASEKAAQAMTAGSHGSTFGGNPLACAAANAVLDIMLAPGFLDNVVTMGKQLHQALQEVAARHPAVFDRVRGLGMMQGLRCNSDAGQVVSALYRHRILTVPAADNVVRLLPALIVEDHHIEEATAALDAVGRELAP